MSIDPHGKFGPLGKYGAYGRVGSIINLVGCVILVAFGTVMIFTQGIPGGMPPWFAVLWVGIGIFLLSRFTLIAREVRRREREQADSQSDAGSRADDA
ncbi:hypothetical protein [Microbacterium sp. SSM24]|uniref:hypothetical protein n=1 Tax=Microbacterium sp. SSM24 TaxID=2991714 RepID=UPI002225BD87|nr:hypothetical protein [Microbacterium sp. SSM24]MCW3493901.1 hypothetical protein [Microbacterium sp. SSM24]